MATLKTPSSLPALEALHFERSYPPSSVACIDVYQEEWATAIAPYFGKYLRDILDGWTLCFREALLNALEHGSANRSNAKIASKTYFDPSSQCLVIQIQDDGPGYDRTRSIEEKSQQGHLSLGLQLIENFALKVEFERKGALLRMFFALEP